MHPEMEPNYSKQRLIFRPKLLLLGWWGGMHPPLNPPLFVRILKVDFILLKQTFLFKKKNKIASGIKLVGNFRLLCEQYSKYYVITIKRLYE